MSIYTRDLLDNKKYVIGDHTYGKPNVYDWSDGGKLLIGKYTSIADEVTILLGGNHRTEWLTTYPFSALPERWPSAKDIKGHPYSKGDVVIGNDVWIGNGATILSGVTIGDGAVIAARAVVSKNVEPFTIVAGNPAKVIKKRFSKKVIKRLLSLRWWDWSDSEVASNVSILMSSDFDMLKNRIKNV